MTPTDLHLLMSISKSIVSTLCGVLIGRGELHADDVVPEDADELAGTSWDECTVQQLLDMRTGTEWEYDRDEEDIFDVSGYRDHTRTDLPRGTASWIPTIGNTHRHGREFRYVSLVTDVLGWVLEQAGDAPLTELISREIWSRIGAERDANAPAASACALYAPDALLCVGRFEHGLGHRPPPSRRVPPNSFRDRENS